MLADDFAEPLLARQFRSEKDHLAFQGSFLEGTADRGEDLFFLEGLGEVVEGAQFHRSDRAAHLLHRGHEDDLDLFVEGLHALQHRNAIHARHPNIQEDEIHLTGANDL